MDDDDEWTNLVWESVVLCDECRDLFINQKSHIVPVAQLELAMMMIRNDLSVSTNQNGRIELMVQQSQERCTGLVMQQTTQQRPQ